MTKSNLKFSSKEIAAINAIEGLYLSEDSKARLNKLEAKNLSPEMQIEAIRKAYRQQTA